MDAAARLIRECTSNNDVIVRRHYAAGYFCSSEGGLMICTGRMGGVRWSDCHVFGRRRGTRRRETCRRGKRRRGTRRRGTCRRWSRRRETRRRGTRRRGTLL